MQNNTNPGQKVVSPVLNRVGVWRPLRYSSTQTSLECPLPLDLWPSSKKMKGSESGLIFPKRDWYETLPRFFQLLKKSSKRISFDTAGERKATYQVWRWYVQTERRYYSTKRWNLTDVFTVEDTIQTSVKFRDFAELYFLLFSTNHSHPLLTLISRSFQPRWRIFATGSSQILIKL